MGSARQLFTFAGLLSLAAIAAAGQIEPSSMRGAVQLQVIDGKVSGCGWRIVSTVAVETSKGAKFEAIDVSFNIYAEGLGLLKGGVAEGDVVAGRDPSPRLQPIESFWLKAQGEQPTEALNRKFVKAETPSYMLAATSMESIFKLFDSIHDRTPVLIGVRKKATGIDRIHRAVVEVSDQEIQQAAECLRDLATAMQASLDATAK